VQRRGIASHLITALVVGGIALGCSNGNPEQRAREMAEKMRKSIPNVEQIAAQQKLSPEVVKKAQEDLTKLYEYMGPITGDLDSVTINAIEAFQREHDLKANGLLDERTVSEMSQAAAAAPPHPASTPSAG